MAESVVKNYFPSQVVSDAEKLSYDYGLKIAKAMEHEWFNNERVSNNRYRTNFNNFHKLRLYARGEQSIKKYKDELSINGDLSYLNLDWTPVPIIPKFVDIVVNGIAERMYDIKAVSQDPYGVAQRTKYMENTLSDIKMASFNEFAMQFGMDLRKGNDQSGELPTTIEEAEIHMQLTYKQSVELAEEQALNVLFQENNYELIKKRFYQDLTVLGIGAVKTGFNTSEGVTIDYVDPAHLVYSYTDSPYFDDIYYVGEVKSVPINEVAKQFPFLEHDDLEEIAKNKTFYRNSHHTGYTAEKEDNNKVNILYFNYKTYMNEVYKLKTTSSGHEKLIPKDDTFDPPEGKEGGYSKLLKTIECLYEGALVLGTNKLLKWEMSKNMMRPKSNFNKVKMGYAIVAPRMYNGKIDSLVRRVTGFADMIQLTHLKLQQVMSRMIPDGVYLDADGLAEIDLGNGTNYNPQEALNMFFQTGSIIGRSFTSEGDMNPGKIPIQEIQSSNGGAKLQSLIQTYNYYLQMIRDVTGLNEARDGSMPDKNALVGVQKLAAANSNTATRHILQAGLYLTAEIAECLSLRVSDIVEFSPTADAFIQSIGIHNTATLKEMTELHLYDFGIFLELHPDEDEKAMLENNIQMALQQQSIELEDAIDIREIKNVKLANRVLKVRRNRKQERDRDLQEQNIQMQSQSNAQAAQQAAQAEAQKNQAISAANAELEKMKAQLESQKMIQEVAHKKELMELEFNYNMQLKGIEVDGMKEREKQKEDRKDERTKIQATQQSKMIEQRNKDTGAKNFESSGNDVMGGGFDLEGFEPR